MRSRDSSRRETRVGYGWGAAQRGEERLGSRRRDTGRVRVCDSGFEEETWVGYGCATRVAEARGDWASQASTTGTRLVMAWLIEQLATRLISWRQLTEEIRLERRRSASDPRRVAARETHDEGRRLGWVVISSGYRLGLICDKRSTATIGREGRGGGGGLLGFPL